MAWQQLSLVVEANLAPSVGDFLQQLGAQAITTENAGNEEFYDVAFPATPQWKTVQLAALFAAESDIDVVAAATFNWLQANTPHEVPLSVARLEDKDWVREWLDSFQPFTVGTNLWVVPSWCEPVEPAARNIRLDPELAFGTGTHATTFLCLNWLAEQDLTTQTVLDYGSGSGILAIAALMSGAEHADAVDIDPLAVSACDKNAARNQINGQPLTHRMVASLPAELKPPPAGYQLVIANILAGVIIALREPLNDYCMPSGQLVLTGILASQAQSVMEAFAPRFKFEVIAKDQWVLLVGQCTGKNG